MLKKVWFQLHWFFGISAGLVLALMGVTGAALSFQDELLRAFNPASLTVQEQPGGTLALDELVRRVESAEPGRKVSFVWAKVDGDEAAQDDRSAALDQFRKQRGGIADRRRIPLRHARNAVSHARFPAAAAGCASWRAPESA